mgnify:CR=1 FL=1
MTRPVLDAGRRALTLPRRLVPVAMLLRTGTTGTGDPAPAGAISELERAGISRGGMLHPLAADLLAVVTGPTTVVSTEVTTDRTDIATIWHRKGRAVLGRPQGPDAFGLHEIEPSLLAFHLAQLTQLRAAPEPPFLGSTAVRADVLEEAENLWHEDPATAAKLLVAGGTAPQWADRLVLAHRLRLRTWCATSLWTTADHSHHDAELRVLDAGDLGYWVVANEPAETPSFRFTVVSVDEVLNRIQALVPGLS